MAEIRNTTSDTLLSGTSAADSINNGGWWKENGEVKRHIGGGNVTISGGAGNDSIYNEDSNNVSIDGGEGDDYTNNHWGSNVTISGGDGNDRLLSSADNSASKVTMKGGKGNDYISNDFGDAFIDGGADDDYIENVSYNSWTTLIKGGAGNDSIDNGSSTDSSPEYRGNGVCIDGGTGNDYINNHLGKEVSINGGSGNDSIYSGGNSTTIIGGTGNDTIYNSWDFDSNSPYDDSDGSKVLFKYSSGDGNDIIYGFKKNSTLSIRGEVYSTTASGKNIIVTVGDGKITLVGAAKLSKVNIDGTEGNSKLITLTEGNDTYSNFIEGATIQALGGNDTINNYNSLVSINGGDGNDRIFHGDGSYVTINAGAGNDSIENRGSEVTITGGAGNDTIYNYYTTTSNVSIDGGAGKDYIYNDFSSNSTFSGGKGNDTIDLNYWTSDNVIVYNPGDGNDLIQNFRADDTLIVSGSYSTQTSGGDVLVVVGDGTITLQNAYATADTIHINNKSITLERKAIWLTKKNNKVLSSRNSISICGSASSDSIQNWRGDNVSINGDAGDDTIENYLGDSVTMDGGKGNDYIRNDDTPDVTIVGGAGNDSLFNYMGNSVAIKGDAGNDTIKNYYGDSVTIDGGAGDDFIDTNGANLTINAGLGNDTINIWGEAQKNLIQYTKGDGNDSISGFDETSTLQIGGGSYSTTKSGKNIIVTVGKGNITLKGAASLKTLNIVTGENYSWKLSGTTATYGDLITVKGVKSTDGLSVSGNVVTVSKSSLNSQKVTISDGYTLKLADDVSKSTTKNSWSLNGTKATCNQTTTAGYTLANNVITYTKEATKTLVMVSGVKSTSGLSLNGKVVTVSKSSLNSQKVTISDGYTLALADDVSESTTKNSWSISGTKATCNQTTTDGYTLANNAISYNKKSTKTLVTVSGVKSTDGLSLSGKVVAVSKSALNAKKVTISDGYTLKLGSDVSESSTKNSWSLSGTKATCKQTTTAGYTLANNIITYTKKSTKTLVTVSGVKSTSGLSLSGRVVTVSKSALNAKKVTISDGYTLALANDVSESTTKNSWSLSNSTATYKQTTTAGYSLEDNEIIYTKKATSTLATIKGAKSKNFSVSGNVIKLKNSTLNKKVTVSGDYEFDFASDYNNALITGSDGDNTIKSSGKNITIDGGAGNDVLTGGSGADVFVYNLGDGDDTITNYDTADIISIKSGTADITTSGDDVIFNVGKGKITVKNSADKTVTYIENGKENIYQNTQEDNDSVIFNANGTAATLTEMYEDDFFTQSEYGNYKNKLVTIDASAVTNPLTIIGNKKGNVIVGSDEDDSISGEVGADKITGGGGNDTIVGGAGNDTLNGGTGADELYGDAGNDSLSGGAGDDSLWGGIGSDTLIGGKGADIFIYNDGDGKDFITDYESDIDKVIVISGLVGNPDKDNSGNVTFKVGNGQIVFPNSANKYIEIVNGSGNIQAKSTP